MKKYLIIVILFMSSFITAQTIITNIVKTATPLETSVYRVDTFYIKSNGIVWSSQDGLFVYHIIAYTKLNDNLYTIHCNTEGKTMTFIVDFYHQWIKVGDNLTFYSIIRL